MGHNTCKSMGRVLCVVRRKIRTLFHRTGTHHFNPLYTCEIIMKQLYLISLITEYSQNCDFSLFYFVSLEVGTGALKIFSVMIPSLVDTSLFFGISRVVRTYGSFQIRNLVFCVTWGRLWYHARGTDPTCARGTEVIIVYKFT